MRQPAVEREGLVRRDAYDPLIHPGCVTANSSSTSSSNSVSTAANMRTLPIQTPNDTLTPHAPASITRRRPAHNRR